MILNRRRICAAIALHAPGAALLAGVSETAQAQAQAPLPWPGRPVRIVVPYAPGSTPDSIARLIFEHVQKASGKPMVIDNRPGAAGMIGTDQVAKAAADGHTLVVAPAGPLGLNALLYKKMPYDPLKDLTPVALVAETPTILVASHAVAATNVTALLKLLADSRNRFAYASPGAGTLGHLNLAYLISRAGATDVPHLPYAGSSQIITGLIANEMQLAALPPLAVAPFVRSGKIKAIATIGPRRSTVLPDVPTLKEQGVDFEPVGWFAVATSAGVPSGMADAIHQRIAEALKSPAVVDAYRAQGLDIVDRSPVQLAQYIARELSQWQPVIQANGITLD